MTNPSGSEGCMLTAQEASIIYGVFAQTAVSLFNDCGGVDPQLIALKLDGSDKSKVQGVMPVDPETLQSFFSSPASKNQLKAFISDALDPKSAFSAQIRSMGVPLPDVLVQINESWSVMAAAPTHPGSLSEHPDRVEVIVVIVHTPTKSFMGICPIDAKDRKASFEPLNTALHLEGRFSMGGDSSQGQTLH